MTDAREIIAYTIPGTNAKLCYGLADAIINRLDAAGFRILGPDEVDPVTLERCAEVTDKRARMGPQVTHEAAVALLVALPDAIRTLGRKA